MRNIRIIKTGINVDEIKQQLVEHEADWGLQKTLPGVAQQDPDKFYTTVDVLQLVMGGIERDGDYVGDSEICVQTPALKHHTEIVAFLKRHFHSVRRCAFFKIPIGHKVDRHTDFGTYYLNKDRYHLSISGRYQYTVYDADGTVDRAIIEPGTLFWFNNKLDHESENIANEPRIAFIFDVPMDSRNP
jgi:hypothetical protein